MFLEILQQPDIAPSTGWSSQTVLTLLITIVTSMFGAGFFGNYLMNRLNLKDKGIDRLTAKDAALDARQEKIITDLDIKVTNLETTINTKSVEIQKLNIDLLLKISEIGTLSVDYARASMETNLIKAQAQEATVKMQAALADHKNCEDVRKEQDKRIAVLEAKLEIIQIRNNPGGSRRDRKTD